MNAFWGKASGKETDEDDDETRDDEDEYEEEEAGICLYKSPTGDPNRGSQSGSQSGSGRCIRPITAMPVSHSEPRARLPTLKIVA